MKDINWSGPMPDCDLCVGSTATEGIYDAPTKMGPWANLCEKHMKDYGLPAAAFRRIPISTSKN